MKYYINGFMEGKNYFLSFGFTGDELQRMKNGETITRGNNTFWIITDN